MHTHNENAKQFLISSIHFVYNIKWDSFNFKCQAHLVSDRKRIREANEWFCAAKIAATFFMFLCYSCCFFFFLLFYCDASEFSKRPMLKVQKLSIHALHFEVSFHFESEKLYFFPGCLVYVCVCQNHLVFVVNLHQIVCLWQWKRKSFHFYSNGPQYSTLFFIILLPCCLSTLFFRFNVSSFFFVAFIIIKEGNKRATVIMINTRI